MVRMNERQRWGVVEEGNSECAGNRTLLLVLGCKGSNGRSDWVMGMQAYAARSF